jgi:hypothetical protein
LLKRTASGIMLILLLLCMLTLAFNIQPVKATISGYEWVEPTYYGYDPFFGAVVVAYRSGSFAKINITVFNDASLPINISAVKLGFDWGINYSSTEVSSQNPYTLMQYEDHTFQVHFTVPSTDIASTTVLHVFTIWVEYVIAQSNLSWVIMANNFAVYPESKTWTVDDDGPADFHTIQEAISAAKLGDTIYVHNGTYSEHVVVNKNDLTLFGENKDATIIDGGEIGTVVQITANDSRNLETQTTH